MEELVTPGRSVCADRALPPCHLSFGETAGLRRITLGNGSVRAEILSDKGANVRQFWDVARDARALAETHDWGERLAEFRRGGRRGSSYSDFYEGGWQDVLPARARWSDGEIGDGSDDGDGDRGGAGVGEAAIAPWEVSRWTCTAAAVNVICTAQLPRCGLEVAKRFGVRRGVAALRVQTTVSSRDVWLSWTQHPALGGDLLDDTSRVWLPGGEARVRRQGDGSYIDSSRTGGGGGSGSAAARWVEADAVVPAAGSPEATPCGKRSRRSFGASAACSALLSERAPSEPTPLNSSLMNQMPRKKIAGISTMSMKNNRKTTVNTREWGYNTKYAPMTAAIAPLAPIIGMVDSALTIT